MTNAAPPSYHIDQPVHWRPVEPELTITGWCYAGPDRECLDLRARVDGVVFLGVHGLDRPDTQRAFGGAPAARRSGFLQRVRVWSGVRELALDYLDAQDGWREFFRTPLDPSALPPTRPPGPRLRAELVFETLHYLYRHFHRASFRRVCAEADRALREVLTFNSDVPRGREFHGFIENPGFWVKAQYDKFRVTGWTFGIGFEIQRLRATAGAASENRLIYPKDRVDVAAEHPDHAHAVRSGYYGLVDIRAGTPSPVNLKIFAELADGSARLVFARRLHLDPHDEHAGPVPVYRPRHFAKCVLALLRGALLGRFRLDDWPRCRAEVRRLRLHLASTLGRGEPARPPSVAPRRRDQDPYARWAWHNRLTARLVTALQQEAATAAAADGPLISILVPTHNTAERHLRALLDSVRGQFYPRWELCLADDASPQPHVRRIIEEAARADPRIKAVFRTENGHIARATNSALDVATGAFIALVDHDDLLPPDSLLHVAQAIQRHPAAGYLYTDEDKIDEAGRRFDPQFKGDWSPEMAITHNFTHHLTVIRRRLVEEAGRLRPDFTGAQDLDLFLRCFELVPGADVVHVPFVGYHWRAHRESTASRGDQKGYLFEAARRAIEEAVRRRGLRAVPFLPEFARRHALCLHQLRWDPALLREQPVTVVIPAKNRADLLRRCLASLARTVPRESVKVVVVDDASDEPAMVALLRELPARADLSCEVVSAPVTPEGFNYSRLVNLGSARAATPLLLHLNNDIEALAPGWLEDLVGWLSVPGVDVAGARLLYPDGRINHAGISISRQDGLPHALFEHEPADDLGYLFLPHAARNVAAVTGACLLTRTALYRELGGFDEGQLRVAYNDVDYCLRVQQRGGRVVYSPQAELQHVGSASRGRRYTETEHVAFLARHAGYRDPYLGGALEFPPPAPRLDPAHHLYAGAARPLRLLLVTHNLQFEGAPILLFEQARHHAAQSGVTVRVASLADGPLRERYAALGIPVEIWNAAPLLAAETPGQFARALRAFAAGRAGDDADLMVGNTLLCFWTVPLAALAGKPSLLYVYESSSLEKLFARAAIPPLLRAPAEAALRDATRVVFSAQATLAVFAEHNANDNFRLITSSVDVAAARRLLAATDRAALRRRYGFPADVPLVINVGAVCERKGQHIFIRAIDQLRRTYAASFPGRPAPQFLIIGARDGLYLETVQQDIALLGLDTVRIVPETGAIQDYFLMADLLVCTSFEESFPRVLLEAMAFGVRIVSTDVFGIPEMLTGNDEAWLVPAGDPFKLSAALQKALADHFAGDDSMTSMAYARVLRSFDAQRLLPRHLRLCREAALG
ncbi:MAG TPA: glycosyltransferase [Opitutaceae bacterium]|nr:glycosyltransferase [Opitutaceae bacterium]